MTGPGGVGGVFDRAADTYDAVGVEWFGPIARGLVDALAAQPGERVLDIGCGRGAATFPLADAVGPAGSVLAVDLAPRMVELTAADAANRPWVEVRVADAAGPLGSGFDVVASSLVLFFLSQPAAALEHWVAALTPGGRLGIATFGQQDPRWQWVDELFTPYLPPRMLDARASGRQGPFASDEGVAGLLAGAGLTAVRTLHATVDVVLTGPQQWLEFSWSHGQRAMWEAVPEAARESVRSGAFALLETMRDEDDSIRLTQQVRYTLGAR